MAVRAKYSANIAGLSTINMMSNKRVQGYVDGMFGYGLTMLNECRAATLQPANGWLGMYVQSYSASVAASRYTTNNRRSSHISAEDKKDLKRRQA